MRWLESFQKWWKGLPLRKRWRTLRSAFLAVSLAVVASALELSIGTVQGRLGPMQAEARLWAFSALWLLWAALILPFGVRFTGTRMAMLHSFHTKQALTFAAFSLFPVGFLGLAALFTRALPASIRPHGLDLLWLSFFWTFGFLLLLALASYLVSQDISGRLNDSLRVIVNGMDMASRLDFDHPIVTLARDEMGRLSEAFNHMSFLLKTRVNVLHALFNNIRIFSGMLSEENILDHTVTTFKTLEEAEEIVIAIWQEEGGQLEVKRSMKGRNEILGLGFSEREGLLGRLIAVPHLLALNGAEYAALARGSEKEKLLWGRGGQVLAVPMMFKGSLKGAIVLYHMNIEDAELTAKMDYLQGLANQIAIFLENARLYRMVIRDRLTSLYVHSYIETQLEYLLAQAKRYKFPLVFVMLDVDKFKQVNDQYGHMAGNKLLKAVAQALQGISRESDLLGRYGGDEFEIVLPHTDKDSGMIFAEKVREKVAALSVEVAPGTVLSVTFSIGLSSYPQDAQDAFNLQATADKALYEAKALGRNRAVAFQAEDQKEAKAP